MVMRVKSTYIREDSKIMESKKGKDSIREVRKIHLRFKALAQTRTRKENCGTRKSLTRSRER